MSFDRAEFGVTFGTSKYLKWLDLTMDAVYTFESLDARVNDLGTPLAGPDRVRSGSFEMRIGRDKRNNPLNPESGYRLFADIEWGSEAWGGEVDYQAADLGLSYHKEIKRGLIWHGSISHSVVGSLNKSQSQIPNNKLLFPGGENSIRGYQRGEAAPRDAFGDFVGAKSFMLMNLELEQRLTDSISIVGFYDGLGMTANIDDYPFDEYLSSVGLGIRFRTFMGPVRLEYGHNLDQRIEDPDGTFHLSLGFPF
ncbi:MAG: BamA/TamA family outer membrane protein [Verrucomicrobia bacterium]|nr:BamA/TamA family outer membrane protein [Verrucomicrobiota bacterium]MDA1067224.1 BamA/TamA family outer membrane protein [Verrucomicrobiota bacterium]